MLLFSPTSCLGSCSSGPRLEGTQAHGEKLGAAHQRLRCATSDPRFGMPDVCPMNRSADSCESFGARLKKVIKHLTCRRRCRSDAEGAPIEHVHKRTVGEDKKVWTQAFTKGYIGTAFTRVCVSAANLYTEESAPYRQREDARVLAIGRVGKRRMEAKPEPARNLRARMDAEEEKKARDLEGGDGRE